MFFEFVNRSVSPNDDSVLTDIYFESDDLLGNPNLVLGAGGQIDYEITDAGNGKPGGFGVRFNLDADPGNRPVDDGVGKGENLLVGLTIAPDNSTEYASILDGLIGGNWILGAHLQVVTIPGGPDSIWLGAIPTNPPNPFPPNPVVPLPGAAGLGMLGLGLAGVLRRKKLAV